MADRRPRRRGSPAADPPGTATRRAALRLIDAVLRRGDPLDIAAHAATQGLPAADRAFAVAIVSETLRWMTDLDRLIDGATAQPLPDDVKSRAVLRLALAQLLVLKTSPHAVVSTALPLVDGGPRRLVHAILSRAQQEEWTLPERAGFAPRDRRTLVGDLGRRHDRSRRSRVERRAAGRSQLRRRTRCRRLGRRPIARTAPPAPAARPGDRDAARLR